MKRNRQLSTAVCASIGMLALILDSKTALQGAAEGVELCIKTVIPNLFPFFVLSSLLLSAVSTARLSIFKPIGRLCGIPKGSETILLVGLLGGYPVGAQCISQAYSTGQLSKNDSARMLGFCNNAGPAFIFGISGMLFQKTNIAFALWIVHICSALLVGTVLPNKSNGQIKCDLNKANGHPLPIALHNIGTVCGWVILFRTLICFIDRWFLWLVPKEIRIFLTGILELANGYLELTQIPGEELRFIFASILLSFGGICVGLQTLSIASQTGLETRYYFPGKILQAIISAALSIAISQMLFKQSNISPLTILPLAAIVIAITLHLLKNQKICSSIPEASVV